MPSDPTVRALTWHLTLPATMNKPRNVAIFDFVSRAPPTRWPPPQSHNARSSSGHWWSDRPPALTIRLYRRPISRCLTYTQRARCVAALRPRRFRQRRGIFRGVTATRAPGPSGRRTEADKHHVATRARSLALRVRSYSRRAGARQVCKTQASLCAPCQLAEQGGAPNVRAESVCDNLCLQATTDGCPRPWCTNKSKSTNLLLYRSRIERPSEQIRTASTRASPRRRTPVA